MFFGELSGMQGGNPFANLFGSGEQFGPPMSMMGSDPFADPSMANASVDPYTVPPQMNTGDVIGGAAAAGGGGFNQDQFLKALGGVKMPAAPAVQAPPRAPDAPGVKTIPGGLQQLLAMLGAAGSSPQIPGLGRGL